MDLKACKEDATYLRESCTLARAFARNITESQTNRLYCITNLEIGFRI